MLKDTYPNPNDEYISEYDRCHLKAYNNSNVTLETCSKWVYSKKYFKETIVTKVNNFCSSNEFYFTQKTKC